MSIRGLFNRIRYLFSTDRYAAELEEEMRLHRELRAQQLSDAGMDPGDAELESRRRFGNVTGMTERSRDAWGFGSLEQLRQDVRYATRRLRQRPSLSVPVIAVIALGIGATTAVFSAVDAAMLRSLPFPRAHELYTLTSVDLPLAVAYDRPPGRSLDITDIRAMRDVFTHSAAYASGGLNLVADDRPQRVNAGVVTTGFFETLGVRPILGRTFNDLEGKPNGPNVVVLGHALWRSHFGAADVIGRSVTLHGRSYTVVGIMPDGFSFPAESQLWIPLSVPTTFATFELFRGYLPSRVVARAAAGTSVEAISARVLATWQAAVAPSTGEYGQNLREELQDVMERGAAIPLQRQLLGDRRRALLVLLGATTLLLLIACANVANLLLSDAAGRRREIAVRGVIGATRRRIVGQLLAESLLLSLSGTLLGVLVAPAALKVLRAIVPPALSGVAPAQLDLRVLAFAIALALGTGLLFGLWPALGATRGDASEAIKSGGGHGATAGGLGRVRRGLVVAEVALTVVLLVGAGLMLKSFERMMGEELGMKPEHVATLETSFPRAVPPAERSRIIAAVLERLATQPGVTAAGVVNDLPLRGPSGISVGLTPHGSPVQDPNDVMARMLSATNGYFEAMGIPLLRGRVFTATEENAAVISKATADAWWPGLDPVGRTFSFGSDGTPITVTGVVADVRERTLEHDPTPQVYQSAHTSAPVHTAIVVRASLPAAQMLSRLTAAMREVAPNQAVYNVRTMEDVIGQSVSPRRTNTMLIGLFAGLALVLSALGVYAVVAYGVTQRSREFGIRAVLGATGRDIASMVTGEMVWVVAAGLALGLAGAWGVSGVVAALLYEVEARDVTTFAAVPLVLLVPALIATLVPALRAMRVNPTEVMRAD